MARRDARVRIGRAATFICRRCPTSPLPGDIAGSKRYFNPDLIEPPIEVAPDGTIAVPAGPGLGVSIRTDRIEQATRRVATFEVGNLNSDVVQTSDVKLQT